MNEIIDTSFRNVILYIAIIVALRVLGKKGLTQISLTDIVLFLVITRAIYNDVGLVAGLAMVATLSIVNYLIDYLTFKSKNLRKLIEGEPTVIIEKGKIVQKALAKQRMTKDDVMRCIRQNGMEKVEEVKWAIIETDGSISVIADSEK